VNFVHFHLEQKNAAGTERYLNRTKKISPLLSVKQSGEGENFNLAHADCTLLLICLYDEPKVSNSYSNKMYF
jgi:hypothetical protein